MIDYGKFSVCGIPVAAVDYQAAVSKIMSAAAARRGYSVSALAVHGIMTGVLDRMHRARLQSLDLVVPDGQPVRWALNFLHRQQLKKRVYGPQLTLHLLEEAENSGVPVFFYGSKPEVLSPLMSNLRHNYPDLQIAGYKSSAFRCLSDHENEVVIDEIRNSGAQIVFVGLGCPRQEVWAYENTPKLNMPVIAVGAAFDFHAGTLSQAPQFMQDRGLEWLYRLYKEPRRLWRRYGYLNPLFCYWIAKQWLFPGYIETTTDVVPDMIRYG